MKNVSFQLLAVIFCFTVLFSCKKNDPVLCSTAWATELQNEITAISTAATVYAMDPTAANCNAFKEAYQEYIDALRPYGNCPTLTGQDRVAWQQSLDDAEASLDSIC